MCYCPEFEHQRFATAGLVEQSIGIGNALLNVQTIDELGSEPFQERSCNELVPELAFRNKRSSQWQLRRKH